MGRKTVYNKNLVTDEKWEKVNEENKDLLEEFLDSKVAGGKSEGTITQYKAMLKIFFVWVMENAKNKHFTDVNRRDLIKFQTYLVVNLKSSPKRVRTIRSAISSLSIFVETILEDDYPNFKNIILKTEVPANIPVREKTVLSFAECEKVADRLLEKGKVQLACFMMVACYSGLRKSELTRLLIKDFTTSINMVLGGSFYKTSPIKVKGHGDRRESRFLWNKADKWLKAWIDYRNENNIDCEYLFCRKENGMWTQLLISSANSFAKSLDKEFEEPIYMHNFRHLLCSELVRAGLPLDVPKLLLGHGNVSVTAIYSDVPEEDTMGQYEAFFKGEVNSVAKKGLGDL